jgi:hypothetical protein
MNMKAHNIMNQYSGMIENLIPNLKNHGKWSLLICYQVSGGFDLHKKYDIDITPTKKKNETKSH